MALNMAAMGRWLTNTIPDHTTAHDKARDFPEARDQLGVAFKHYSLGLASGAAHPLGTSDEGDIRLLEIFPSPSGSGRIRGALHHYCFLVPKRRIRYRPVSYVWGSEEEERLIVIDGKGFLVTQHLNMLLLRLREQDRSVYVWIDAICIYQKMTAEKEKQLLMMKDIYSTADEVIVYLGEDADGSDLVVDFARTVVAALSKLPSSQATRTITKAEFASFKLPPVTDPGWKAFRAVLRRPWFQRKWIIQEYALAKSVIAILGDWCFNFDLLVATYQLSLRHDLHKILEEGTQTPLMPPPEHPLNILSTIKYYIRRNFDDDPNAEAKTLPWLLMATSYAQVSKHRHDHIYALLGMHEVSGDLLGLPYPITDYDTPVETLFISYACIDDWKTSDQEVSLLELATQPKKLSLPSWVPDWTCPTSPEYVLWPSPAVSAGASPNEDRSHFSFDEANKRLTLRVAFVTRVEAVGTVFHDRDTVTDAWKDVYAAMTETGFGYLAKLTRQRRCRGASGEVIVAHEATQVGDQVIIVFGERALFVARPCGAQDRYTLVGCAYSTSAMRGQGLNSGSPSCVRGSARQLVLV